MLLIHHIPRPKVQEEQIHLALILNHDHIWKSSYRPKPRAVRKQRQQIVSRNRATHASHPEVLNKHPVGPWPAVRPVFSVFYILSCGPLQNSGDVSLYIHIYIYPYIYISFALSLDLFIYVTYIYIYIYSVYVCAHACVDVCESSVT